MHLDLTVTGLLLGGLLLLFAGGEALVRGAAALGMRMGLSALATGLTIVAFGTSTPELVVNLKAATLGQGGLAVGNVVGSNIANIGLILGLTVLIKPVRLDVRIIRKDIYIMLAASMLAFLFLMNDRMGRVEGMVLAIGIIGYVWFNLHAASKARQSSKEEFEAGLAGLKGNMASDLVLVAGGLAALILGGSWFVDGAVALAQELNVSPAVIGLTVVAIGTSLPELAATAVAAYRGHGDIAIGNIVGSNIFNVLAVLGFTSTILPLNRGDITNTDLVVFLLSGALLLRLMQSRSRLDRWEGAILLGTFCAYTAWRVS
jgi:cation:H+ antiporter